MRTAVPQGMWLVVGQRHVVLRASQPIKENIHTAIWSSMCLCCNAEHRQSPYVFLPRELAAARCLQSKAHLTE